MSDRVSKGSGRVKNGRARPGSSNKITMNSYVQANPSALRAWRLYSEKSRIEVGEYVGVHPDIIGRWERGDSRPTYRRLFRMAKCYGCDFRELLYETSKFAWMHLETVLVETMLLQRGDMESGQVPNLDFDQLLKLSEKLGVFDLEPDSEEVRTPAESQVSEEVR